MTRSRAPAVPLGAVDADAALQQTHWPRSVELSSIGDGLERFLAGAGFDRGPWLAVAFAGGIGAWFALPSSTGWLALIGGAVGLALFAAIGWRRRDERIQLRLTAIAGLLALAGGTATIWVRSELVGAQPLARITIAELDGRVLERIAQPADQRVRLVLAARAPDSGRAIKVRVNLPLAQDRPEFREGAVLRFRARLIPPAPPLLPGAYNFARTAWFEGYAATGSVLGEIRVLQPAHPAGTIAGLQRTVSEHVRARLGGSAGAIAAAFASGDRGAIAEQDEVAMRDAGLTHLLSISGLHVSAVIAAAYFLAMRLLGLWQWLALRVRLPLLAAGVAALAGIGYTLLTGAEVPTVRSCVGAVLVLLALALGREPLSLRMVAVAAGFVLALWPESLVGPSFQMSFAAVIAIVALHTSRPVRSFLAPREEPWPVRLGRNAAMLLVTGCVIELALMPVVLYHFHRAGMYGALANVVAIPLTTFISMPLIALALLLDAVGLGAPVWWLAGKSLDLLLALAHFTAAQPGAVKLMPQMGGMTIALFVFGGLWLGLWRGTVRLWGLLPTVLASGLMLLTPVPDLLITGDGRHVGIAGEGDRLLILRDTRSSFARDNLAELSGMEGEPMPLAQWQGARCSPDFCVADLTRGGTVTRLLLARSDTRVAERELAAACDRVDIVVADRTLPRSCRPQWLKADRRSLARSGGLAIYLKDHRVDSVARWEGAHGWWHGSGS